MDIILPSRSETLQFYNIVGHDSRYTSNCGVELFFMSAYDDESSFLNRWPWRRAAKLNNQSLVNSNSYQAIRRRRRS